MIDKKQMMSKEQKLKEIYQDLENNVASLPLAKKPEDIVPGEGNADAEVLCIGEAPGFYEAQQRRPFVGRSGQLLRKTLTEIETPAEQIYITNIVKVRPPDNRDPSPEEILAYKPFLDREIELLNPAIIVTLGRFSMAKFLPDVKISQVHGRLHKVHWNDSARYILPMYHPAAGLRSTKVKESFIADMNKIPKIVKWVRSQKETEKFAEEVGEALF